MGIKELVKDLLTAIGEDPAREGLDETPRRVEKSFQFLTSGYRTDIDAIINVEETVRDMPGRHGRRDPWWTLEEEEDEEDKPDGERS